MIDEELRTPSEQVRQRGAPLVGVESILLVDPNPGQFLPLLRQLVAAPRKLLLRLEQLEPCREPLLTCAGSVLRHVLLLSSVSNGSSEEHRTGGSDKCGAIPIGPWSRRGRPQRANGSDAPRKSHRAIA